MNVYFRMLQYAPGAGSRFVKFILFSVLSSVFSATYLGLLMPMMNILFKQDVVVPTLPAKFEFSGHYFKAWFQVNFLQILEKNGYVTTLLYVCIGIVVFVFLANLFKYMERMVASRVKVDVVRNIRVDIFKHVSLLHIGYFNDQRKGDLISRFTNDVSEMENTVVNGFKAIREPITLMIFIILLFTISVKLSLFTLIILPLAGGVIASIIKRLKQRAVQSQEAMGRIVNILDEAFSGMRVINAFNARNFLMRKIENETTFHRKVNLSISRRNELSSPLSEFLGIVAVAAILFYGGQMVMSGDKELTPSAFLLFITYYASMIQPAKNFSNGVTSLQKGSVAAERIFKVIDIESQIKDKPDAEPIHEFKRSIEFQNVSFAYEREAVLKNISLKIEKGKTIALVGPSGGGKSTLADLVPRFYDPSDGVVLMDGRSLKDYKLDSIRDLIGVVTQESILFNDTIFNNIAFGRENAKEEDVVNAARIANAHSFIMETEHGYQTMIGERGSKLSGGQRQRLSIARAVLKNPPILILDEATSALDSESERLVQEALTNLMKNRTSIVIAHRLSTIQHADEIVVIQNGVIIERGSHEDLIGQDGLYKKLNEIQKL